MTDVWGPIYWIYLHLVSKQLSDSPNDIEKSNYFNLVKQFINTIPCSKCKDEINKMVDNNELQKSLNKKNSFENYIWDLHNRVNEKLNKPIMKKETFNNIYDKILNRTYGSNLIKLNKISKIKTYIILLLLLLIIIIKLIMIHIIIKTKYKFKHFDFLNKMIQLFHQ